MIGEAFLNGRVHLNRGDSREVLKSLPDNSVDSVATDPPYALDSIVKRFGNEGAAPAKKGKGRKATGAYARASAGFMGQKWDTGDTAFDPEFWKEVYRVLKPGGHLAAFSGTRTQHKMITAIEAAGFEIRDDILRMLDSAEPFRLFLNSLDDAQRSAFASLLDDVSPLGLAAWCYGTGFPKSHDVSKAIDRHLGVERTVVGREFIPNDMRNSALLNAGKEAGGRAGYERDVTVATSPQAVAAIGFGTALKPAWEPILIARKPLIGTVAENWLEHGTGGINIDGCRVETDETITATRNVALGSSGAGVYGGANTPGVYVQKDGGRHPANLIHDGSAEVLAAFPQSSGQQSAVGPAQGSRGKAIVYGEWGARPLAEPRNDQGSAARFYYSSKADSDDRIGSNHPTVKPVDLMMWLVRMVTPPGGVVLDPFAGTGTTGEAAWAEGMRCILIEREAKYCDDIRRRLKLAMAGPDERAREALKANGKAKELTDAPDEIPLFKALA